MMPMGSPSVPYPQYLITLTGPNSGAGAGRPGAAVRDAATGRVIDRVPGRMDVYSAVTGTGNNRLFYLAARSGRAETAQREPDIGQIPPGGAFSVQISDAGTVVDLSAVPGIPEPEPASHGPAGLTATADGSTLAYPVTAPRNWRPPPPSVWPVRDHHKEKPGDEVAEAHFPPAVISIVRAAAGERMVWQAGSGGFVSDLSLSADGRRMAFSWHGLPQDRGIHVVDLPATTPGAVITTPSRLVVPDRNTLMEANLGQSGLGCLGQAVISADGSALYVTAARGEPGGQAVTRLAKVSVADGRLLEVAYERPFRDPGNIIYGWGPLAIDPAGQHALIAYTGHLARIDLNTAQLTELPIAEHLAHSIAW
jgi:hypothetical protein